MSSQKVQLADDSSFAHLLENGGHFESPAQRKDLQDTVEKSTAHDTIEDEIQESSTRTQKLQAPKIRVRATVSQFQELLTPIPIDRLPTEILVEIFLILRDTSKEYTTTITQGVWPLTYVSHKWRSTTVSLPMLWSYISIGEIEEPAKDQLQLLKTALARSSSHPLHLEASFSSYVPSEPDSDTSLSVGSQATNSIPFWPSESQLSSAMMRAVVQHSDQWVTAHIDIVYADCLRPIYRRLSSLEKLTFWGDSYGNSFLFSVAPKLRDVEIRNVNSSMFQLPWKQFVRFHESLYYFNDDPLFHYLQILRNYPQLEDFGDDYDGEHEQVSHQSVTHDKLKAFSCTDFRLIRCLTLPSLRNLHLRAHSISFPAREQVPAAHELLNRSRCTSSLRVLHLESVLLDRSVFDLLEFTKGLAELNFTFGQWETSKNAFMKHLINRMSVGHKSQESGKQVLIPRLESFTINIRKSYLYDTSICENQFIDEKYVDMVEGRWNNSGNGVSRLRVVKFESNISTKLSAFTDRCIQRMKKMRDEGLTMYIAARTCEDSREDTQIYVNY
ncbi:hypothetical protein F5878DRAFT_347573 [Lentinula raphanica]|uniref:F-box domain-containing protein n=1 Tax=Lentinula raphanica TaxID=153919 RepID=A0AA38U952_9AGAR|nr:hypothetical protein F5878DRAFT_347573 [Lentinula raphanica]